MDPVPGTGSRLSAGVAVAWLLVAAAVAYVFVQTVRGAPGR